MHNETSCGDFEQMAVDLKRGSEKACEEFVRKFVHRIYWLMRRRGWRQSAAEEIAVDTIEKVVEKIDQYERKEGSAFEAWVFRIADNEANALHRIEKRLQFVPLNEAIDSIAVEQEEATESVRDKIVREHLASMKSEDREILTLVIIRGMNASEAADELKIEPPTARKRLERAKQRLREKLEKDSRLILDVQKRRVHESTPRACGI